MVPWRLSGGWRCHLPRRVSPSCLRRCGSGHCPVPSGLPRVPQVRWPARGSALLALGRGQLGRPVRELGWGTELECRFLMQVGWLETKGSSPMPRVIQRTWSFGQEVWTPDLAPGSQQGMGARRTELWQAAQLGTPTPQAGQGAPEPASYPGQTWGKGRVCRPGGWLKADDKPASLP